MDQAKLSCGGVKEFAFVIPQNQAAADSLDPSTNRDIIDWLTFPKTCPGAQPMSFRTKKFKPAIIKLNFASMLYRKWIHFGRSRSNQVVIKSADVDAFYFKLHFDTESGSLLFTDTSATGTWLKARGTNTNVDAVDIHCHGRTIPISGSYDMSIGRHRGLRFQLVVVGYRLTDFQSWLEYYLPTLLPRQPQKAMVYTGETTSDQYPQHQPLLGEKRKRSSADDGPRPQKMMK